MTSLLYTTSGSRPRKDWMKDTFFPLVREEYGNQAVYVAGRAFGASWATGLIGPDFYNQPGKMPDGYPWNGKPPSNTWPPEPFNENTYHYDGTPPRKTDTWIRAHLINQGMGGNTDWKNLAPFTKIGNSNHETVETFIRNFLTASLSWDNGRSDDSSTRWIGVYYCAQCAVEPLSHQIAQTDLYSYAPNFIKLTWRAVSLDKPKSTLSQEDVRKKAKEQVTSGTLSPVAVLPFRIQNSPVKTPTLPPGYTAGGRVQGTLPPFLARPAQPNGFDGEVEIHIPV
ncbi:hypothetical protein ABY44_37150 [Burkholderia sp. ZZQ-2]